MSNSFKEDIRRQLKRLEELDDKTKDRVTAMRDEMSDYGVNLEILIWQDVVWRRHGGSWDFWIASTFPDEPRRLMDMGRHYRAHWFNNMDTELKWCLGAIVQDRLRVLIQERESLVKMLVKDA